MKRDTAILAAIDNQGNIAPNSVGMYNREQHEGKFDSSWTVVEVLGKIPVERVYEDYLVKQNQDLKYEFILKDATDRWHFEVSGDDTIPADGTSSATYTIKKVDADGADYITGTEQLALAVQRGSLDTLTLDLVAGAGTVTLTSVAETVSSGISVTLGGSIVATKLISFVPV
jgi:hypothetical protein